MEYIIIGVALAVAAASLIIFKRDKPKKGKNVNNPSKGGGGKKPDKIKN